MSFTSTSLPLSETCKSTSSIPEAVTITFTCILFVSLIGISIYAARTEQDLSSKWQSSKKKWFVAWIKSTWKHRGCYLPALTHLFDQVTDIGVVFEFADLSRIEKKLNTSDFNYCPGVNTTQLFYVSLSALLLYRVISAIVIGRKTRSIWRFVSQLFDLELFYAILNNYRAKSREAGKPQRLIQSLEASLESMFQTLIQFYFIAKTSIYGESSVNALIFMSFAVSLLSMISKAINEDKSLIPETNDETLKEYDMWNQKWYRYEPKRFVRNFKFGCKLCFLTFGSMLLANETCVTWCSRIRRKKSKKKTEQKKYTVKTSNDRKMLEIELQIQNNETTLTNKDDDEEEKEEKKAENENATDANFGYQDYEAKYIRNYGSEAGLHCSVNRWLHCECISLLWVLRVLFRVIDVITHIFYAWLLWMILSIGWSIFYFAVFSIIPVVSLIAG